MYFAHSFVENTYSTQSVELRPDDSRDGFFVGMSNGLMSAGKLVLITMQTGRAGFSSDFINDLTANDPRAIRKIISDYQVDGNEEFAAIPNGFTLTKCAGKLNGLVLSGGLSSVIWEATTEKQPFLTMPAEFLAEA